MSSELSEHERLVAAELLEMAADAFANHICNDFQLPSSWTVAERCQFNASVMKHNGWPQEDIEAMSFDDYIVDYMVMDYLAARLKGTAQ